MSQSLIAPQLKTTIFLHSNSTFILLNILAISLIFFSCNTNSSAPKERADGKTCSCQLSKEEMITECPVDAEGDSIIICKEGTIKVIGSKRDAMTWPEYISSEYFGGEGRLIDCKTGNNLFPDLGSAILSYRGKRLMVDKRLAFDIFDPATDKWVEGIELPAWRKIVYAVEGQIKLSPDSLIFKPPFHGPEAFATAAKEYGEEMNRTDHYLYMRTVNRLFICGLCGDTLSDKRLPGLEKDFSTYFSDHPDSKKLLHEKIGLYKAYKAFIQSGGKQEYFDLSVFPYFKNSLKKNKK